jgi:hypothetical protein
MCKDRVRRAPDPRAPILPCSFPLVLVATFYTIYQHGVMSLLHDIVECYHGRELFQIAR